MVIDSHVHVAPGADVLGARQDASVETFLAAFDAAPLDAAVLLPIEPVIPVPFVFEVAARRPGRLYCYGSVNPADGPGAVAAFDAQMGERDVRGLKLHPRRQGIRREHWPVVLELTRLAAARGVPVLVDSFPYGKGALRDDSLELIEAMSEAVPDARIIIAHLGGVRVLDALILARTSYTIYLDLSLTYWVYRGSSVETDVFYAIKRIGADRCLYGTDYPDVDLAQGYRDMRAALEGRGFSDADLDWIFWKSAAQLLRIEPGARV